METIIGEQLPILTNFEFQIFQRLKKGYSRKRIAHELSIQEESVRAISSRLAIIFDLHRPTRRDWMQCKILRKTIETKEIAEILRSACNRSEEATRLVIMEIAEELCIEIGQI